MQRTGFATNAVFLPQPLTSASVKPHQHLQESQTMERRHQRSEIPGKALEIYLSHLANRSGARSVVIADDRGLLVGGSGDTDLDLLAVNTIAPVLPSADAKVHELRYAGTTLRLSSLGGMPLSSHEVGTAVGRILALPRASHWKSRGSQPAYPHPHPPA